MARLTILALFLFLSASLMAQEYSGNLFETHSHIEDEDEGVLNPMIDLMETHDVDAALVFTGDVFLDNLEEEVSAIRGIANDHSGKLVPFFNCDCESASELTSEFVQQVVEADPGLFAGLGENALYSEPWSTEDIAPNEEPFLVVYDSLTEASLWIMFHPNATHEQALNEVAADNPDQKFLIHGYAARDYISTVLRENANVYLTVDTAALLTRPGDNEGNTLLYAEGMDTAGEFLEAYEDEKETLMDNAIEIYKPIIEANPDQVMWGTDVSRGWHVDDGVYGKLIEFSREFIAQLDSSVQEKYAHTNALAQFTPVPGQTGSAGDNDDGDESAGGCSLSSHREAYLWEMFLLLILPLLGLRVMRFIQAVKNRLSIFIY